VCLLFLVPLHTEQIKHFGGANDPLNDNGNISYIKIVVRDDYRIALAVFMSMQDDELARLVFPGNLGASMRNSLTSGAMNSAERMGYMAVRYYWRSNLIFLQLADCSFSHVIRL